MIGSDLSLLWAEVALALYAMAALMVGVWGGKDALARTLTWSTALFFIAVALVMAFGDTPDTTAFGGLIHVDGFGTFAKVVILISAAVVLVMGAGYMERRDLLRFEYPILITLAVIGMMVMVAAADLMTLYMGLELQSLALYIVASLRRDHANSTEAGMKYFVLGALSSGILLYGASLVYGYTGTTRFEDILTITQDNQSVAVLVGLVLVISGLAFKVSAVPFHMWTPDVYEGAPTPITAFFATAPKVAAMALFARVMHDAFGAITGEWQQVVALIAILSMFLGSIAAIGQTNIKRLMAYSSIAHMGYALIGLAAGTAEGVSAMLFYMVVYVTMNIGTFAFILSMERDGKPVTDINALAMYSTVSPMRAMALLVLMFSLAGVPPMLGFFAKFSVWQAAVSAGLIPVVIASAVASAIGAYYYLRIVFLMYFGTAPQHNLRADAPQMLQLCFYGSAILMLAGVVTVFGLDDIALHAAEQLVGAAN